MVTINKSLAINPGTAATQGRIIVLHSTDDIEATAANIATYEHRVWKSAETFVHYAVDDKGAYQIGVPGRVAWGAGNVNRYAPVQIELCEFFDKARALKAYKNMIALAVAMAKQYGVNRTLDDSNRTNGFKSHDWCSRNYGGSDHSDPYPWLTKIGISKAQLAKDLGAAAGSVTVTTPAAKPAGKGGTYTFKATTNVRSAASTSAAVVAQYKAGQTVSYSSTVQADGYTWMVYTGASGKTRYVAQTNGTTASKPTASSTGGRVAQSGTWRARTTVNVRAAASTSAEVVAQYKAGQTVKYDSYIDAEGIRWCSYIGGSGKRRYVARRNLKTGYLYADAY